MQARYADAIGLLFYQEQVNGMIVATKPGDHRLRQNFHAISWNRFTTIHAFCRTACFAERGVDFGLHTGI